MLRRCLSIAALLSFVSAAVWASSQQPAQPTEPARFAGVPRVTAYRIDARLDVNRKTIDATEVLRYRNLTGQPLQTFPFHLYLNAFQPGSTFLQEARRNNPKFQWNEKNRGAIQIKSLEAAGVDDWTSAPPASAKTGPMRGTRDLTSQMRFIQPDDGNAEDRTVFELRLPAPVAPGQEVEFRIAFQAQLPEVLARTGYKHDFFMVAQWFPKVGVWWRGAWNCHQFHENTEFFADFGTYDVKLTVPQNYVVGGVGEEVGSVNHPDGTKTVAYHAEAVHDFAWTADPRYRVREDIFRGSAGPVRIRLLMQPEHMGQLPRYLNALRQTMQRMDEWYGPYPYPQITVVDVREDAGRAGGMEYPTLITTVSSWWLPQGIRFPEDVIVHEYGHQYWYGMVATNEFEEAWLDEGINSYTEVKLLNALFGPETIRLGGATMNIAGLERRTYARQPDTDPLARPGWQFLSRSAYSGISYGKTAVMLLTLEDLVGEGAVQAALRTYFLRYRFTHPTGEDFLKTVEEVTGKDLRWYFSQAVYGTHVMDYEVAGIESIRPYRAATSASQGRDGEGLYENFVVLHRKGDFVYPVTVEVKFDDGERVRERWDGRDRWTRFTYRKQAKVVSAEIDPDHRVWLDIHSFNNSRTSKPHGAATRKLANYWMFLTQMLAQWLAWLV